METLKAIFMWTGIVWWVLAPPAIWWFYSILPALNEYGEPFIDDQ